jgi:hypothetical protein
MRSRVLDPGYAHVVIALALGALNLTAAAPSRGGQRLSSYVLGYQNRDVGNTTRYNVTGLSANMFYYYRLRAYNGGGTSPKSNVIKVKTKPH